MAGAMTIGRALRSIVEEHVGDPIRSALRTEQTLRARLGNVVTEAVPIKPWWSLSPGGRVGNRKKAPILVLPAEKLKKQVTIECRPSWIRRFTTSWMLFSKRRRSIIISRFLFLR